MLLRKDKRTEGFLNMPTLASILVYFCSFSKHFNRKIADIGRIRTKIARVEGKRPPLGTAPMRAELKWNVTLFKYISQKGVQLGKYDEYRH